MRVPPITALLVCLLSGCAGPGDRAPPAGSETTRPARVATPPPVPPRPARLFACDGGHRVELLAEAARVTLVDGRIVDVPADGAVYRGEALGFIPAGDHGTLAQDEVGAFPCRRAD